MARINNARSLATFIISSKLDTSESDVRTDFPRTDLRINDENIKGNYETNFKLLINKLFKNSTNLDGEQKKSYEEFLKRYLHQHAMYHKNVKFVVQELDKQQYSPMENEYHVSIRLKNKDLYIEDEFTIKKIVINTDPARDNPIQEAKDGQYLIHGQTTFKLQPRKRGAQADPNTLPLKLILEKSSLDCTDPKLEEILDQRTPLEKFIDAIKNVLKISTAIPIPKKAFYFFQESTDKAKESSAQDNTPALTPAP